MDVDDDAGVQAAIDGEMALLDPEVRASRERSAALLDPDVIEFGSSGRRWDRESILAAMMGPLSLADGCVAVTDVRGVRLSENIVHVTYATRHSAFASRRSSVWRKTDDQWRLYFHQGTPLPLDDQGAPSTSRS